MAQAPAAYAATTWGGPTQYPAGPYTNYPNQPPDYSAYWQQYYPGYQYQYTQQDPAYAQAAQQAPTTSKASTNAQPPLPPPSDAALPPPLPPGTESSAAASPTPPPPPSAPVPEVSDQAAPTTAPAIAASSATAPPAPAAATAATAAASAEVQQTAAHAPHDAAAYQAFYGQHPQAAQAAQQQHEAAWAAYFQQHAASQQYDPNAYAAHQAYANQQYAAYAPAGPIPGPQPAQPPWQQQQQQPQYGHPAPQHPHPPAAAYAHSNYEPQPSAPPSTQPPTAQTSYIRPNKPVVDFNRAMPYRKAAPPAPAYTKASISAPPSARFSLAPAAAAAAAAVPAAPAAPAQPAASDSNNNTSWPPSLKDYVMRAFKSASGEADRRAMEIKLRDLINAATKTSTIWVTDWDTYPAPSLRDAAPAASRSSAAVPTPSTSHARNDAPRYGVAPRHRGAQHAHEPPATSRAEYKYEAPSSAEYKYEAASSAEYKYEASSSRPQHTYEPPSRAHDPRPQYDARAPHKVHKYKIDNRKRSYESSPSSSSDSEGDNAHHHPQRSGRGGGAARPNEASKRQKRVGRFGHVEHPEEPQAAGPAGKGYGKGFKKNRKARLAQQAPPSASYYLEEEEVAPADLAPIVGTCQNLEKSYFRLTSFVDPATVRPVGVLERSLARLVGMLARGEVTYFYACDQFKGMRQDLTVQHVRSDLTVRVYEAHGRAALEYGEVSDFNQCQTQLYMLYADGLAGAVDEFLAYRVLYQTVHAARGEQRSLLATLQQLPQDLSSYPTVKHAVKVRRAVFSGDFGAFFRLYAAAPALSRALMDTQVDHVRHCALVCVCKAMRPTVPVATLAQLLGFGPQQTPPVGAAPACAEPLPGSKAGAFIGKAAPAATAEEAEAACQEWMISHGATVNDAGALVSGADSAKSLFVPVDTSKVAHGDANLCIEDFFAKL